MIGRSTRENGFVYEVAISYKSISDPIDLIKKAIFWGKRQGPLKRAQINERDPEIPKIDSDSFETLPLFEDAFLVMTIRKIDIYLLGNSHLSLVSSGKERDRSSIDLYLQMEI